MTTYAVTAASGQLGRLAVEALLARGVPPRRRRRRPHPGEGRRPRRARGRRPRRATTTTAASLATALAGVDRLLLVSGSEPGTRVAQHTRVVEAAKAAGVSRIAYTSILRADTSAQPAGPGPPGHRGGPGRVRRPLHACCATAGTSRTTPPSSASTSPPGRSLGSTARAAGSTPPPAPTTPRRPSRALPAEDPAARLRARRRRLRPRRARRHDLRGHRHQVAYRDLSTAEHVADAAGLRPRRGHRRVRRRPGRLDRAGDLSTDRDRPGGSSSGARPTTLPRRSAPPGLSPGRSVAASRACPGSRDCP